MALTWQPADLRRLWPHAPQALVDGINAAKDTVLPKYDITTQPRICEFMGVNSEETGGGVRLDEDLRYSGPRLWTLFGRHQFASLDDAIAVAAHGAVAIADRIYGNRMGNRPGTDDGYAFRGQGLIQLTGRGNATNVAAWTGIDYVNHPEWLMDPAHCLEAAAAYWKHAGCNELADTGSVAAVTRRVNGGLINIQARVEWFNTWRKVPLVSLTDTTVITPAAMPLAAVQWIKLPPPLSGNDPSSYVFGSAKWAQAALNVLGTKPPLKVDGWFGTRSETALLDFQRVNNLPKTRDVTDGQVRLALAKALATAQPHSPSI